MFHGQLKNTQFIFNSLLSESFIYYLVLCANIYIYKKRVPGFINNKWNKIFFTWFCFLIKNAFEPQTCRWQTEVYSPALQCEPAPSSLCSPSFISLCVKRCIIQFAGQLWLLFKRLETVWGAYRWNIKDGSRFGLHYFPIHPLAAFSTSQPTGGWVSIWICEWWHHTKSWSHFYHRPAEDVVSWGVERQRDV